MTKTPTQQLKLQFLTNQKKQQTCLKMNSSPPNTISKRKRKTSPKRLQLTDPVVTQQHHEVQNEPISQDGTNKEIKPQPSKGQLIIDNYLESQQNTNQANTPFHKITTVPETPGDGKSPPTKIDFFCPHCGSTDNQDGQHIKKEIRHRKHKGEIRRWYCKKHKKKFMNDPFLFNYPNWVIYFAAFYLAAGMSTQSIIDGLMMVAREKEESLSISPYALRYLFIRIANLLNQFEHQLQIPIVSKRWEVDEICHRLPKRKKIWVMTICAYNSRYLLAAYVCLSRRYNNSCSALREARDRSKCDPKILRCDGLKSHKKACEYMFPNARVISIAKDMYLGLISHIERIHATLREGVLYKRRRFRTPKTLQAYADIGRFDYNFVRINDAFGKTPAAESGMEFKIKDWHDLFDIAKSFYKKSNKKSKRSNKKSKRCNNKHS